MNVTLPDLSPVHSAIEVIRPVAAGTHMLQVLDVFRDHQQEHFFPVLDDNGRPHGLICERSLKGYVYSRFGVALLANPRQSRDLESFLSPCPVADINASIEQVLEVAHRAPNAEGVMITSNGSYVGFVRASALVELAHARQMEIVRQHNAALDLKNREIQAVLQNMRQGICTVLPDLSLHQDFSAHLASILEQPELAGKTLMQTLFAHSTLGVDQLQQVEAALMAILDQDELMYECNAHLLPGELTARFHSEPKQLELHWRPMLDEQGLVSRLMLVVRDVSAMRALQAQAARQQRELQLLGEILLTGETRFTDFMSGSVQQLEACRRSLAALASDAAADVAADTTEGAESHLAAAYRAAHTIKGNARTLGLLAVTDSLHHCEQLLQQMRDTASLQSDTGQLSALEAALACVETELAQYQSLYEQRLRGFGQQRQRGAQSLQALFVNLGHGLPGLAQALNKTEPQLLLDHRLAALQLSEHARQPLNDALTHILRNCMDHGLESAEERLAAGKTASGQIRIETGREQQTQLIWISDDGRGLDMQRLRQRALASSLLSREAAADDEQLKELIFRSGLSTAQQVSMVSGRGVGMDAVRASLAEIGAEIAVEWQAGSLPGSTYRPFRLRVSLPGSVLE